MPRLLSNTVGSRAPARRGRGTSAWLLTGFSLRPSGVVAAILVVAVAVIHCAFVFGSFGDRANQPGRQLVFEFLVFWFDRLLVVS